MFGVSSSGVFIGIGIWDFEGTAWMLLGFPGFSIRIQKGCHTYFWHKQTNYIYIYMFSMYIYIYLFIYLCLERERERERRVFGHHTCAAAWIKASGLRVLVAE